MKQNSLGNMYKLGLGVQQDYKKLTSISKEPHT